MKLLYFSNVNWNWIKQRPHFIPLYLSKQGVDVTFISLTPFGKQKKSRINKVNDNLVIKDKYVIPFASKFKLINKLNKLLFIDKEIENTYDFIVITHPNQYYFIEKKYKKNKILLIYECMDNIPYFYSGSQRKAIVEQERKISSVADKIIVSSNYLKNKFINEYNTLNSKITVIKNGVDPEFSSLVPDKIDLQYPNLVYIGTISNWIDFNTLDYFAKTNPEYTIYMVGPIDESIKDKINSLPPNITFVGKVEHHKVIDYINSGDIMIIPFVVNDLIQGVDPVKLYEYLAFNKNIISSYWEELNCYRKNPHINFYNSQEEFCEIVRKKLKYIDSILDKKFISQNSWLKRTEEYIDVLNNISEIEVG